jgi:hypothetical protein
MEKTASINERHQEPEASSLASAVETKSRAATCHTLLAWLALAMLFFVMLTATWQRWVHPIIDHGREMHLPARLLAGEQLYTDILYYYGPFAPHFNALLYRVFGVHLAVLHASGLVCAALILLMIYSLARQLMGIWEAALAAAMVLLICVFNVHLGNYLQPYAYAALYGLVFALGALVCAVRYLQCHGARWLSLAGASTGLVLICKPEFAALAIVSAGLAWLLVAFSARTMHWRAAFLFALPTVAISSATYGWILRRVPLDMLIAENYRILSMPQVAYFSRHLSGALYWPQPLWEIISSTRRYLFTAALSALLGILISRQWPQLWRGRARRLWGALLAGLLIWWMLKVSNIHVDASPLKAAPLMLVMVIAALLGQWWQARNDRGRFSTPHQILLVIAVFSLLSITRVFLSVGIKSPYTAFTVATAIVVYLYLLFRFAPSWLLPAGLSRENARRCAMIFVAVTVVTFAIDSVKHSRRLRTFEVSTPRGSFLTEPAIGRPLADALRFAEARTSPEDYLLALPQGTAINFLINRRYPLREENIVPGFLTGEREAGAIERIIARRVPLILVANFPTPEYRDRVFGIDYNQKLMNWINQYYQVSAIFSASGKQHPRFGDKEFFILAYERKP